MITLLWLLHVDNSGQIAHVHNGTRHAFIVCVFLYCGDIVAMDSYIYARIR